MSRGEVCIPNIGPRGQRLRARLGWIMLTVAVGLGVVAGLTDAPLILRLGVFLPAVVGATGVFQAREKT